MATDSELPRTISRSPWTELCLAATAFTIAANVVFRISWTASPQAAEMWGLLAAACAAVGGHVWCRRAAREDLRGALDVAHMGVMRAAIGAIAAGGITFASRLATTELFAAPLVSLALGWAVLIHAVLVDRKRSAWAANAQRGEIPGVRITDRPLKAPLFFEGTAAEITLVRSATDAFRGDEPAIASLPRDPKTPSLVRRRQVAPLLLAVPCAAALVMTFADTPKLGLPAELASLAHDGNQVTRIGPYPYLFAPGLAFWTVAGPAGAYHVVALEQVDGKARLLTGPDLFLRIPCDQLLTPPVSSTCARWASDVLTGKDLILSGTQLEARQLKFDGVVYGPSTTPRQCFAVDLDVGELHSWDCPGETRRKP